MKQRTIFFAFLTISLTAMYVHTTKETCTLCNNTYKDAMTHVNVDCNAIKEVEQNNFRIEACDRFINILKYLDSPNRTATQDKQAKMNLCKIARNNKSTNNLKDAAYDAYYLNFMLKKYQ